MDRNAPLLAVALILLATPGRAAPSKGLILSDKFIWTGEEGNSAVRLTAKFRSREQRLKALDFGKSIGEFKDPKSPHSPISWHLLDITFSLDLNVEGEVAIWSVSGPKPLIARYIESVRADCKTVCYDFGIVAIDAHASRD